MLIPGLVSVTFRKYDKFTVSKLAADSGLFEIEWGGDVHVPPSDKNAIDNAIYSSSVNKIKISSYGSYYRSGDDMKEMQSNIETAHALGAKYIRIWAGNKGSAEVDDAERSKTVNNIIKTCDFAKQYSITVCPEFHIDTLTDDYNSALKLVDEVGRENFKLYWQPNQFRDEEYNLKSCKAILPFMTNVHVFHWIRGDMYPLQNGKEIWKKYFDIISSDNIDHSVQMEFVCDGSAEQFKKDAKIFLELIK